MGSAPVGAPVFVRSATLLFVHETAPRPLHPAHQTTSNLILEACHQQRLLASVRDGLRSTEPLHPHSMTRWVTS
jgi:hypothetical protein